MKEIDLSKSLFDLTEQYPELIEILKEVGFLGVANNILRKSIGKVTNIPQGCEKLGINLDIVKKTLEAKGFKIKLDK